MLAVQHLCDGGTTKALCAALYKASGDNLVQIDDVLACVAFQPRTASADEIAALVRDDEARSSGSHVTAKRNAKQPKHEGHCAATVTGNYRHCRRLCGQPFTSKR